MQLKSAMLRTILVLSAIILLGASPAFAQLKIYRTYEDYKSNKGEEYGKDYDIESASVLFGALTLTFKNTGGDKVKLPCNKAWGVLYKGMLFRMEQDKKVPVALLSDKDLCYYENGIAYMFYLKNGGNTQVYIKGESAYFSKSVDSEIYPFDGRDITANLKKISAANPKATGKVNCLVKCGVNLDKIRACIGEGKE